MGLKICPLTFLSLCSGGEARIGCSAELNGRPIDQFYLQQLSGYCTAPKFFFEYLFPDSQ